MSKNWKRCEARVFWRFFFLLCVVGAASNFARAEEGEQSRVEPLSMQRIFASSEFGARGVDLQWAPVGGAFVKRVASSEVQGGQDVVLETPEGEQTRIVAASELLYEEPNDESHTKKSLSINNYALSDDSNLLLIYTNSKRVWRRDTRGDYWIHDRKNSILRKLGGEFESSSLQFAKISPDRTRVAYVYKNNLYVESIQSGKIVQLTFDGNDDVINGTFDWVYEEEFDCRDGFRWAPDGKKIAFWRLDSSSEPLFTMIDNVGLATVSGANKVDLTTGAPVVSSKSSGTQRVEPYLKSYPNLTCFKYPRVGCPNATVAIGIVTPPANDDATNWDAKTNTIFVDFKDDSEYYLPSMEWYSSGLLVQKTPRSQRFFETFRIDPESGVPTLFFTEADPDGAWQESYPIYPLKDGARFLRISERDGWRRCYLTSFDAPEKIEPITSEGVDAEFVAFDYDASGAEIGVYYYAAPESAARRALYRASLTGENARVLIDDSEVDAQDFRYETWNISADSEWAICRRSSFGVPTRIELTRLDAARAKVVKLLEDNAALREKLERENFGKSEFVSVEIDEKCDFEKSEGEGNAAQEKVSLDGWIMYPRDWNEKDAKRYPLLVYVYGEPASQTVLDSWGGSTYLYHRAIAERGCVVVSFDGRGTPAPKGRQFRKKIYQKFGAVGRSDQAAALRVLLSRAPFRDKIDPERVGVWGWSGGGTSTLNLLFNYPDLYRCGIAIAPVADYRNYDTIYQERYSGLITETPESYELGSPIGYAQNLQGWLLLIHGSGDDNCHFQTSEKLVDKLISFGKEFEFFEYPSRSHGIFEGSGTTLHLRNKTLKFWEQNLL